MVSQLLVGRAQAAVGDEIFDRRAPGEAALSKRLCSVLFVQVESLKRLSPGCGARWIDLLHAGERRRPGKAPSVDVKHRCDRHVHVVAAKAPLHPRNAEKRWNDASRSGGQCQSSNKGFRSADIFMKRSTPGGRNDACLAQPPSPSPLYLILPLLLAFKDIWKRL
jgi:hypothetical protein